MYQKEKIVKISRDNVISIEGKKSYVGVGIIIDKGLEYWHCKLLKPKYIYTAQIDYETSEDIYARNRNHLVEIIKKRYSNLFN